MTKNQDEIPQWVIKARDRIKRIKEDLIDIRKTGDDDIRRGLETKSSVDKRLQEVDFLEQLLNQGIPQSAWDDEIIRFEGRQVTENILILESDVHWLLGLYRETNKHEEDVHFKFNYNLNSTGTSSDSLIYTGLQIENRLVIITLPYKSVIKTENLDQQGSRQKLFSDLEDLLKQFDNKFLNMLRGSEDTLNKMPADYLSQASHSMRDLFEQIIKYLAPADVVKKQPWFKETPAAPQHVSRLSRLRYILYGSGDSFDEREIKRLDAAAESAKQSLDLAINRAHDHDPELDRSEVILSIDHVRLSLYQVLKQYKNRHKLNNYIIDNS